MALIECKECGHKVSDKAECCPNCGCPIEEIMSADASNDTNVSQVYDDAVQFDDIPPKKSKGWLWTIVVILVLAAIGVGVWLFTNGKLGEDDPTTAKVEITPEFIAAVHQYDELYPFSEGLAAVKKDGKFGYINTKGELVIPCQFDKACDFSDGLAIVMDDEYNIKILDIDGNVKSTPYILDILWYGTGGWHYDKGYYSLGFVNNRCTIKTDDSEDEIVIDANGTILTHPSENSQLAYITNPTDTISYNPILVRFSVKKENMYHNEVEYYGIRDSSNEILAQPQYYHISDFHNGVAQVVIFIGQAETKGIPYGFHLPDGEYFFGYIDKDGNSTFTDADFKKIEAYKKEQLAKKEELDRQAAEEEQARLEEERRQMGTDFVVTMTADFNKYGEICNESSTIGHIIRFRDSFETKYYVVPKGKRMKYLYYREHNNNISIYDDLRIDIYDEDNRNLVAQHNLRECGEFNILSGQRFGIKAHTIGCHSSNEYRDCHFNMEFVFKVFDE